MFEKTSKHRAQDPPDAGSSIAAVLGSFPEEIAPPSGPSQGHFRKMHGAAGAPKKSKPNRVPALPRVWGHFGPPITQDCSHRASTFFVTPFVFQSRSSKMAAKQEQSSKEQARQQQQSSKAAKQQRQHSSTAAQQHIAAQQHSSIQQHSSTAAYSSSARENSSSILQSNRSRIAVETKGEPSQGQDGPSWRDEDPVQPVSSWSGRGRVVPQRGGEVVLEWSGQGKASSSENEGGTAEELS